MLWTEEQESELKQRIAVGESAREIGAALNLSRNAVLGKIHRLGLSNRTNRSPVHRVEHVGARRNGGAIKSALKARRAQEREIALRANQSPLTNVVLARARAMGELPACEAVELPSEQICREPVALLDLQHHHCRWPVDVDGMTMFCGADKHTGAYCEGHARIAYITPRNVVLSKETVAKRRRVLARNIAEGKMDKVRRPMSLR